MLGAEQRSLIVGAVLVLALYAGLSCWPALMALLRPAAHQPAVGAPPPAPAPTTAPSAPVLPGAPPTLAGRLPASSPAQVLSEALADAQAISAADSDRPPVEVRWQVLSQSVEVFERPRGPGVMPPAASHATLTICRGASLQVLSQQGNWAQVRSRGQSTGWVCVDDLALTE